MVAKFLDDKNREFCNGDGEQQKNSTFRLAKKQLCTCIALFYTFLSCCCTNAT